MPSFIGHSELMQKQAILLLGGENQETRPRSNEVVRELTWFFSHNFPKIISTGIGGYGIVPAVPEARQMKNYIQKQNPLLNDDNFFLEEESREHYAAITFASQYMQSEGIDNILLCTSDFNMPRAQSWFKYINGDKIKADPLYARDSSTATLSMIEVLSRTTLRTDWMAHNIPRANPDAHEEFIRTAIPFYNQETSKPSFSFYGQAINSYLRLQKLRSQE